MHRMHHARDCPAVAFRADDDNLHLPLVGESVRKFGVPPRVPTLQARACPRMDCHNWSPAWHAVIGEKGMRREMIFKRKWQFKARIDTMNPKWRHKIAVVIDGVSSFPKQCL